MGIVWKAWDSQLKRVVALKEVLAAPNDSGRNERFLREAQMAARLRHPNIVTVHDVGSHQGTCYLTAEYVPGVSLDHVLAKGPLPFRRAVQIAKTCAEALYSAHQQRILHRDVKPANILLDDEGRPYITDFGLAKDVSAGATQGLTLSGNILGTPMYMSPEQASGRLRDMGPASDQFSLGIVLYEMLTGQRPFGGDSLAEILNAIIKSEPRRPREINEKIPPDVEATCMKALAKDPARRHASLAVMASDLGRFLEEKLVVEPPPVPPARPPERRKKTAVVVPPNRVPPAPRSQGTPVAAKVPMEAEARRELARKEAFAKVMAGDLEGAIADLTDLIKAGPEHAAILNLRGAAYYDLGDFVNALADADRACDLAPDDMRIRLNRGQDRLSIGDLKGAREDFDKVLKLDGASIEAFEWRSRVRLWTGDLNGAIADAEAWSKNAPDDPAAHLRLAYALDAKGDTQKAVAELGVALEGWPKDTDSSYMRAYLDALKAENGQSEWIASACRARRAWLQGDYATARQGYESALQGSTKRDEDDPRTCPVLALAHVHLAFIHCLLSQGRTSPAVCSQLIPDEQAKLERTAALDCVSRAVHLRIDFSTFAAQEMLVPLRSEGRWIELENADMGAGR